MQNCQIRTPRSQRCIILVSMEIVKHIHFNTTMSLYKYLLQKLYCMAIGREMSYFSRGPKEGCISPKTEIAHFPHKPYVLILLRLCVRRSLHMYCRDLGNNQTINFKNNILWKKPYGFIFLIKVSCTEVINYNMNIRRNQKFMLYKDRGIYFSINNNCYQSGLIPISKRLDY